MGCKHCSPGHWRGKKQQKSLWSQQHLVCTIMNLELSKLYFLVCLKTGEHNRADTMISSNPVIQKSCPAS